MSALTATLLALHNAQCSGTALNRPVTAGAGVRADGAAAAAAAAAAPMCAWPEPPPARPHTQHTPTLTPVAPFADSPHAGPVGHNVARARTSFSRSARSACKASNAGSATTPTRVRPPPLTLESTEIERFQPGTPQSLLGAPAAGVGDVTLCGGGAGAGQSAGGRASPSRALVLSETLSVFSVSNSPMEQALDVGFTSLSPFPSQHPSPACAGPTSKSLSLARARALRLCMHACMYIHVCALPLCMHVYIMYMYINMRRLPFFSAPCCRCLSAASCPPSCLSMLYFFFRAHFF